MGGAQSKHALFWASGNVIALLLAFRVSRFLQSRHTYGRLDTSSNPRLAKFVLLYYAVATAASAARVARFAAAADPWSPRRSGAVRRPPLPAVQPAIHSRLISFLYKKRTANNLSLLMHRLGIEPRAIAWKANMLPLHQRCFNIKVF